MRSIIISDTSCLILLEKIGELLLVHELFGDVTITPEVAVEFGAEIPDWCKIQSPENKTYQKILETSLDKGEASAIALAIEQIDCLLIIDDLKGRKYAEQLGINITGTLGILVDAKQKGLINSIKPSLEKIKMTNFRLTKALEDRALERAGEL